MENREKRQRVVIGAVCLLVGGALGIGGMVIKGKDVEERVKTEIVTETKYVYKTIYKENEIKEEKKKEKKDVERERVVERKIVVPCKCQKCSDKIPEGIGILKGEVLGLELPEGYYVIEERIGEKEKNKSGIIEKRREEKEIRQNERIENEDEHNHIYQSNRIEKSKEMNWMVGVRVEYGFGDKELMYGVGVKRRIVGPVFVGVSGGVDGKANVNIGGDVSIGF